MILGASSNPQLILSLLAEVNQGISSHFLYLSRSVSQQDVTGLQCPAQDCCDVGTAKKRRAVKVTGDTRVFEDGQIGEAPGGGSLSTYKELCSLATEVGQPDLLYKFMDLANHAAALNSSRGAAFGYAQI